MPRVEQDACVGRRGKLVAAPEACVHGVEIGGRARHRRGEGFGCRRGLAHGGACAFGRKACRPEPRHARAVVAPAPFQVFERGEQRGAVDICRAPHGALVGRDHEGHRPARGDAQRLQPLEEALLHVGAFLAVDLDAHERAVQALCHFLVGEGLARHDAAPVAARISDRDEDEASRVARPGERLVAPPGPVDGARRALAQVGRALRAEAVGRHRRGGRGEEGGRDEGAAFDRHATR
jgi:hypothetical protein